MNRERPVQGPHTVMDVFKNIGSNVFNQILKKAAKNAATKAITNEATKTGEHVGEKAGDKIIEFLSRKKKTPKPKNVTFDVPTTIFKQHQCPNKTDINNLVVF